MGGGVGANELHRPSAHGMIEGSTCGGARAGQDCGSRDRKTKGRSTVRNKHPSLQDMDCRIDHLDSGPFVLCCVVQDLGVPSGGLVGRRQDGVGQDRAARACGQDKNSTGQDRAGRLSARKGRGVLGPLPPLPRTLQGSCVRTSRLWLVKGTYM